MQEAAWIFLGGSNLLLSLEAQVFNDDGFSTFPIGLCYLNPFVFSDLSFIYSLKEVRSSFLQVSRIREANPGVKECSESSIEVLINAKS